MLTPVSKSSAAICGERLAISSNLGFSPQNPAIDCDRLVARQLLHRTAKTVGARDCLGYSKVRRSAAIGAMIDIVPFAFDQFIKQSFDSKRIVHSPNPHVRVGSYQPYWLRVGQHFVPAMSGCRHWA